LAAAEAWGRLKTPKQARAASEWNRRCLIGVEASF
jgi:hypothetical protein